MSKITLLKNILLFIAAFYAFFFIVALWTDDLTSRFFFKFSITVGVIEAVVALFFYFEYWHSESKKDKKDYFAD